MGVHGMPEHRQGEDMKKVVFVLIIAATIAGGASAAGGKNQICHHGEIGQGEVVQHQVRFER